MIQFLDCGCCLKDDGTRVWCPTCEANKTVESCSSASDGSVFQKRRAAWLEYRNLVDQHPRLSELQELIFKSRKLFTLYLDKLYDEGERIKEEIREKVEKKHNINDF